LSARVVADYHALAGVLAQERAAGRSVALANGCFDLLHVGHVRLIAAARREADILVVALNDDASVRSNKGSDRPLVPLAERMEVVAALAGVDYVTSFPEHTADALIRVLRPDVLAKGTDRDPETIPEAASLAAHGGRVAICGDPKGHSSSLLIARSRRGPDAS
jgi:rfaE bifunctional protein nucleotidyltransferase chain/domain